MGYTMGFAALCAALAAPAVGFVTPAAHQSAPALRASVAAEQQDSVGAQGARFGPAAGVVCGLAVAASAAALARRRSQPKTAARYTTQVILPALQWIKTGLKASDLQATELKAKNLAGVDVLVGKDGSGKLFCVGNLCPHIGTPMSEGADVIGDVIVCPLHGSSFKVTTGELIDWCPSPPIIGPLTGLPIEKKNLAVFDVRSSFFGGDIEVLVDTNAKKAWEADYWKGILDAQGKDDGTYY